MAGPTPDGYRLETVIGTGATGKVWRAVDPGGARVAVKLLDEPWGASPAVREAFAAQRAALTAISSPHLVRVRELVIGNPLGVVMDLVDGEDLRSRLTRGRLDAHQTALLGAAVAQGLQTLHERGHQQGDLRCENILLPDGDPARARLVGFGLTSLLAASGSVPERTTPNPAPELAAGGPASNASDIHALGVVLYEAVNGPRSSWDESVPASLREAILELVAAEPQARPNAAVTAMHFTDLAATLAPAGAQRGDGAAEETLVAPVAATLVQPAVAPDPTVVGSGGAAAWIAPEEAPGWTAPAAGPDGTDESGGAARFGAAEASGDDLAGAHAAPTGRGPRSRRGLVPLLVLALAVLGGGGAWALTRGGGTPSATRTVTAYASPAAPSSGGSSTTGAASPAPASQAPASQAPISPAPVSSVPAVPTPAIVHQPVALNPEAKLCSGKLETGDVPYVNVAVGDEKTTSCAFAIVVAQKYRAIRANGATVTFEATSPTTGGTYSMTCTGSPMVGCTGGTNAVVLIW